MSKFRHRAKQTGWGKRVGGGFFVFMYKQRRFLRDAIMHMYVTMPHSHFGLIAGSKRFLPACWATAAAAAAAAVVCCRRGNTIHLTEKIGSTGISKLDVGFLRSSLTFRLWILVLTPLNKKYPKYFRHSPFRKSSHPVLLWPYGFYMRLTGADDGS